MPAHVKRTPERDAVFFQSLLRGATVTEASAEAGYDTRGVYRWRARDAAFCKAWRHAVYRGMEEEADRRLRHRYERPVMVKGEQVGVRNVCFDALLFSRYDTLWRERYLMPVVPDAIQACRKQPIAEPSRATRALAWLRSLFARPAKAAVHAR